MPDLFRAMLADLRAILAITLVVSGTRYLAYRGRGRDGAVCMDSFRKDGKMTTILETPRLILREWLPDDWVRFKPIATNPQVIRYVGTGQAPDDEQIRAYIEAARNLYRAEGFCLWPLIHRDDQALIGFCGLDRLWGGDEIEIGYWLSPDYWGRGLATEAAQAVMQYGQETLGLRQIVAVAQPANRASIRVLEKLGMTYIKDVCHEGVEHVFYRYAK